MSTEGDAWHAAAHHLGLHVFLTSAPLSEDDSFRQAMARLGMEATRPRSTEHMMAGAVDGVRVLIAVYATPKQIGVPTSDIGGKYTSLWTGVIAELDPNLQLGLRAERATRFSSFFLGEDLQIGAPELDSALRVQALDQPRLRELFVPRDRADHLFTENLRVAAGRGLFISDSMVGYKLDGAVTDAITLQGTLSDAIRMRHELARRAERVHATHYEIEVRRDWASYAEGAGLAFDPARISLQGVVRGVPIEIAQEGAPGRLQLAVRCRFPQPIPAQVRLTKTRTRENVRVPVFVQAIDWQDVVIGDAAFDNTFQIRGYPIEPVHAAFANPAFRAQLLTVARVAETVDLTHDGVAWFIHRPVASASELADHVDMAVRVARSREAEASDAGPYR